MPSINTRPEVKIEATTNSGLSVIPGAFSVASGSVAPFMWNGGAFGTGFSPSALAVAAAHKPQIPGFPSLANPVNGLSPIPSSSKLSADNSGNRHKLHELKTDTSASSTGASTSIGSSGAVQGRSITAGTSGNPMDILLRPQVPRPLSAAPSPAAGNLPSALGMIQQQMLLRGVCFL